MTPSSRAERGERPTTASGQVPAARSMSDAEDLGFASSTPSGRRSSSWCRAARSRAGRPPPPTSSSRTERRAAASAIPSWSAAHAGSCRSASSPTMPVRPAARLRAITFGRYPSSRAASSTASRRSLPTLGSRA
nr:hypothetical protein [Actinomadura sp. J1-007]